MISILRVKRFLKSIPVVGPFWIYIRERQDPFSSSSEYWERRYRSGGNSGAGSYNRLAEFKANFLNTFVEQHQIDSVIEFGCGDGAQLKLARYPKYTGVDISPAAVEKCRNLFCDDVSKRFMESDVVTAEIMADLSLSLDVVYHLVEEAVFDAYMMRLFGAARSFVIVYSSNIEKDSPAKHVRHREFTQWVVRNKPDWQLQSTLRNAYPYDPDDPERTSFADFFVFAPK